MLINPISQVFRRNPITANLIPGQPGFKPMPLSSITPFPSPFQNEQTQGPLRPYQIYEPTNFSSDANERMKRDHNHAQHSNPQAMKKEQPGGDDATSSETKVKVI